EHRQRRRLRAPRRAGAQGRAQVLPQEEAQALAALAFLPEPASLRGAIPREMTPVHGGEGQPAEKLRRATVRSARRAGRQLTANVALCSSAALEKRTAGRARPHTGSS